MSESVSRREFLKNASIAGAAGIGASSLAPLTKINAAELSTKSRVVIATDPSCVSGGVIVSAKIPPMVDAAIMTLTGITDKGKAYEALFPKPVTISTKIVLKRNDASSGKSPSNPLLASALTAGFASMLGGTFPAANVTVQNSMTGTADSTVKITAGGGTFPMKKNLAAADYIINCPVAWCHSEYGVTLSLKNTMNYIDTPSKFHSLDHKWLHECSLSPSVKPKQILAFMDAVYGNQKTGPGSAATFNGFCFIVSKDLVAVDYNTLRLMAKQTSANANSISTGDSQLKAAATAGLGTNDPAQMEIINIQPPWGTGLINESESLQQELGIEVHHRGHNVEFVVPHNSNIFEILIFDAKGKCIFHKQDIATYNFNWDFKTANGANVSNGMYIYKLKTGFKTVEGIIHVSR